MLITRHLACLQNLINLEMLNESAHAEVTLEFADSASMESAPIFYEIYYDKHCFDIQPFSYGTIMMESENSTDVEEQPGDENTIRVYPNPASGQAAFLIRLDRERKGEVTLFDISGQEVKKLASKIFQKGETEILLNTTGLKGGVYHYTFFADDIRMRGKLVVTK